jgi:hypothetical protein
MLARCARCQGTFTTDRFGRQFCPHCGSELDLADPAAGQPGAAPPAPGAPPPAPPPAPPQGGWGASGGGYGPPPGGWAPPPGGYGPPPGYGPPGGYGYPPPPPEPELAAPFAERDRRGFVRSFFETWKLAAIEPQRFFRRVRVDQYWSAALFAVIAYTIGGVASGLYNLVLAGQNSAAMAKVISELPPNTPAAARAAAEVLVSLTSGKGLAVTTVFSPAWGFIALFVSAGITHLFLMLFQGASRGFGATLTVYGYSYGLYLLLAIPGCGSFIAAVWQVVVVIIGLAHAQRCGVPKALGAVLLPVVVFACCCGAAAVGLIGAFAGGGTTSL